MAYPLAWEMRRRRGAPFRRDVRQYKTAAIVLRRRAVFQAVVMADDALHDLLDVGQEVGIGLEVAAGQRVARKIDVQAGPGDLRRQTAGMPRHDDGDNQMAGQAIPELELTFDKLHRGKFAPRV